MNEDAFRVVENSNHRAGNEPGCKEPYNDGVWYRAICGGRHNYYKQVRGLAVAIYFPNVCLTSTPTTLGA